MAPTIEDLKTMEKVFLTATDVAEILGSDPQSIRVAARQRPDLLGFPVTVAGSRVRIPRIPFLRFIGAVPIMKGENNE